MARRLFVFKVRADAHAKLEAVLAAGEFPHAECRETADEYSVWSASDALDPTKEGGHGPPVR